MSQRKFVEESKEQPQPKSPEIPKAPMGFKHVLWLGPSFLWMVSAAGSGEMLFTPRVAAQYGYVLLWALILAVLLKLFMNHEIGRYAVATGAPVLQGFGTLPGKFKWAVWLIVLPQLVVAPALNAGMAGAAATAAILFIPWGGVKVWATVLLLVTGGLVLWGKYGGVEKIATFLGIGLAVSVPIAAVIAGPDWGALASGLVPSFPQDVQISEILPWLGFMMAGAAGMMWYSYWVSEKGYGAGKLPDDQTPIDLENLDDEHRGRLKGWIGQMTIDNLVAIVGVLLPTIAFLILGAEILMPRGLVPEENRVGEVLAQLLGEVWGSWGRWLMIAALFIGFSGTLLSQHDGYGRLFSDGFREIGRAHNAEGFWADKARMHTWIIVVLTTLIPIGLFLWRGQPVQLLMIAGAIEAAHIAIVAVLILYLNKKTLPKDLQPNAFWFYGAVLGAVFFTAFAGLYLLDLAGVSVLGGGNGSGGG